MQHRAALIGRARHVLTTDDVTVVNMTVFVTNRRRYGVQDAEQRRWLASVIVRHERPVGGVSHVLEAGRGRCRLAYWSIIAA